MCNAISYVIDENDIVVIIVIFYLSELEKYVDKKLRGLELAIYCCFTAEPVRKRYSVPFHTLWTSEYIQSDKVIPLTKGVHHKSAMCSELQRWHPAMTRTISGEKNIQKPSLVAQRKQEDGRRADVLPGPVEICSVI